MINSAESTIFDDIVDFWSILSMDASYSLKNLENRTVKQNIFRENIRTDGRTDGQIYFWNLDGSTKNLSNTVTCIVFSRQSATAAENPWPTFRSCIWLFLAVLTFLIFCFGDGGCGLGARGLGECGMGIIRTLPKSRAVSLVADRDTLVCV